MAQSSVYSARKKASASAARPSRTAATTALTSPPAQKAWEGEEEEGVGRARPDKATNFLPRLLTLPAPLSTMHDTLGSASQRVYAARRAATMRVVSALSERGRLSSARAAEPRRESRT